MFTGLFRMHSRCPECGLRFEREQGFFVGAMYVNYAATVALVIPGYFILSYLTSMTITQHLILWISVATVFPLWFFRYSRSLWWGLDYLVNPEEVGPQSELHPKGGGRRKPGLGQKRR